MTVDAPRSKDFALALLAMTQFVIIIDASIVNAALPSIGRATCFSQADLVLISSRDSRSYSLAARIGDASAAFPAG
jgi:hypothetical protein